MPHQQDPRPTGSFGALKGKTGLLGKRHRQAGAGNGA